MSMTKLRFVNKIYMNGGLFLLHNWCTKCFWQYTLIIGGYAQIKIREHEWTSGRYPSAINIHILYWIFSEKNINRQKIFIVNGTEINNQQLSFDR